MKRKFKIKISERGSAAVAMSATIAAAAAAWALVEIKKSNQSGKLVKKTVNESVSKSIINHGVEVMNVMLTNGTLKIKKGSGRHGYPTMSMQMPKVKKDQPSGGHHDKKKKEKIDPAIEAQAKIKKKSGITSVYMSAIDPRCAGQDEKDTKGTDCDKKKFTHNVKIQINKYFIVSVAGKSETYINITASVEKPSAISIDAKVKLNKAGGAVTCPDMAAGDAAWENAGDPYTFSKGRNTSALGRAIRATHVPCGGSLPPNGALRMSTGASGGANKWDSLGTYHVTTKKACDLLGYDTFVSATCHDRERSWRYPSGKCNWHSPHNDWTYYWRPSDKKWINIHEDKYTTAWIATLTCKDKR